MMPTIFPNYCLKDPNKCCMKSDCEPESIHPCLHCQYWKPTFMLYEKENIATSFSEAFGLEKDDNNNDYNIECYKDTENNTSYKENHNKKRNISDIIDEKNKNYDINITSKEIEFETDLKIMNVSDKDTITQQKITFTTLSMIKKFEDMKKKSKNHTNSYES